MIPSDIDRSAPVVGRSERFINHPLWDVWGLHANIGGWNRWQSDIRQATPDVYLSDGLSFTLSFKGAPPITWLVHSAVKERSTLWESSVEGCRRVARWEFDKHPNGVMIIAEESWDGPPFICRSDVAGTPEWRTSDPGEATRNLEWTLSRWLNFLASATVNRHRGGE